MLSLGKRTRRGRDERTNEREHRNMMYIIITRHDARIIHITTTPKTTQLVVVVLVQILLEPIHILEQVFHAVHQPAVRAELQLVHDVVDGYQIPHVERHLVAEVLRGRVEIRDVYPATVLRPHREAVLFVRLFGCSLFVCSLLCAPFYIYYISIDRIGASGECEARRRGRGRRFWDE